MTSPRCRRGHKWTDENSYLYLDTKGVTRRKCRQCTLERSAKRAELAKSHPKYRTRRDYRSELIAANTDRILELSIKLESTYHPDERAAIEREIEHLKKQQQQ